MHVSITYSFLIHCSLIIFSPLHEWHTSEAHKPQVKFMSSLYFFTKHSSISYLQVFHCIAKEEIKVWVRILWILIHSFFLTFNCCGILNRVSPLFFSYFIKFFLWDCIHIWGSHLAFTGIQKQTIFMSMFSCVLIILFQSAALTLWNSNRAVTSSLSWFILQISSVALRMRTKFLSRTQILFHCLTCVNGISPYGPMVTFAFLSSSILGLKLFTSKISEFLLHSPITSSPVSFFICFILLYV